jgi:hypothetical protein
MIGFLTLLKNPVLEKKNEGQVAANLYWINQQNSLTFI